MLHSGLSDNTIRSATFRRSVCADNKALNVAAGMQHRVWHLGERLTLRSQPVAQTVVAIQVPPSAGSTVYCQERVYALPASACTPSEASAHSEPSNLCQPA